MEQTFVDALESARYCRQELQKAYAAVMFSTSAVANYDEEFKLSRCQPIWSPDSDTHLTVKSGHGLHNIFEHTLLQVMEMQKHLIDREATLGAENVANRVPRPVNEKPKVENTNSDPSNFPPPPSAIDDSKKHQEENNLQDTKIHSSGKDCNPKSPIFATAKKEIDKIFDNIKVKNKEEQDNQAEEVPDSIKDVPDSIKDVPDSIKGEVNPPVQKNSKKKTQKMKKKKTKKMKKISKLRHLNSPKKLSRENKAYRDSIEKVEQWNTTNVDVPKQ